VAKKPESLGKRVQLHRALSKLGWGSRTQAWEWIRSGQVCVDGRVVTDPLAWVDLHRQHISRSAEPTDRSAFFAPPSARKLTLALHKPRGIVTTRSDERGRRTVYDLLPADLPWVFPVGRLDADSEGLLILTNDSDLSVRLTEPAYHVAKTYRVTIAGVPEEAVLDKVRGGPDLADGPTRPVEVRVLRRRPNALVVEMILTEGRNRQIRRLWAAMGHRVRRLVRVAIGAYRLGDLLAGACRELSDVEVRQLTAPPPKT
jgi:23S rRNA pseudouridine2605 synthase